MRSSASRRCSVTCTVRLHLGQKEIYRLRASSGRNVRSWNTTRVSKDALFADHLCTCDDQQTRADETVMCQLCGRRRKPVIETRSFNRRGRAVSCLCKQPARARLLSFSPHPCQVLVCVLDPSCPSGNAFGRASPCVAGVSFPDP